MIIKEYLFETIMAIYIAFFVLYYFLFFKKIVVNGCFRRAYARLKQAYSKQTLDENKVYLIYKKVFKKRHEMVSYLDFLETILIDVDSNLDVDFSTYLNTLVQSIIEKEKVSKPYSNVEEMERRILIAIDDAAPDNEKKLLKKNLEDLSMIIAGKEKALNVANKKSKFTTVTTIVGIILTILMGWYGSYMSKENIDQITEQVSNQISKQVSEQIYDILIMSDSLYMTKEPQKTKTKKK